jgi:hydrogenase expression/formation protein HypC
MCLGVPGRIIKIHDKEGPRMADVDFGGAIREVCLDYVPEASIGDYCLVHVGFALNLLDEADAQETLSMLRDIAQLQPDS